MKTLVNKLSIGFMLIGLTFLLSCSYCPVSISKFGMMAVKSALPVLAKKTTTYTGNKITNYLMNSSATKGQNNSTKKISEKSKPSRKGKPISIGMTGEAHLAS